MTTRVVEGFDWFPSGASTTLRNFLWAANGWYKRGNFQSGFGPSDADVTTGRFGFGKALLFNSGNAFGNNSLGYVIPVNASQASGYFGGALHIYAMGNSPGLPLFGFYDGVNDVFQVSICFDPNGVISVWRGNRASNNRLATSIAGVWQEGEDFHFEVYGVIAASGGSIEVRINTVPVIQLVGANTKGSSLSGNYDSHYIGGFVNNNSANYWIDDFFANDTTGAQNNTWLGNVRVKTQFITANGAIDNFTIGGSSPAATQWQSVNNQNLDDTKYVYSPNIGDIDLFTPDPNLNSPLVHAVQVRAALRQDDATQRVARHLLRIGATNYLGTVDHYTNQTYTFYRTRWELNPATGVAFTGSDVNGLQAGVKVQA
jgi:hypothetical protein